MSTFSNPAGAAAAAQRYTNALLDVLGDRDPLAVMGELERILAAGPEGSPPFAEPR